ncbi:hypothetical protein ABFS82_06G122800 [Erythranthe guttata]
MDAGVLEFLRNLQNEYLKGDRNRVNSRNTLKTTSPHSSEFPTETGEIDYDDDDHHVAERTIISSRWANDADRQTNEADEDKQKLNRKTGSELAQVTGCRNSVSPPPDDMELVDDRDSRVDMLQCCRSVHEFEKRGKINEGTYGVVYRAKDSKTGEIVALKKVKMKNENEKFPLTSLREINILRSLRNPYIVDFKEVVVDGDIDDGVFDVYMVMEYMDHDLKGLMEKTGYPFSQSEVKCLMLQLLEGVKYVHENWILHRDLKTSNLLLNKCGELKICDFGLSRQYGNPLKPYSDWVVTLPYRSPELLLEANEYSTAIDMWSVGCIMAELLLKRPLFNGTSEINQLHKIFRILGTPNETIWPGFSKLPGAKAKFVEHKYNQLRKIFQAHVLSDGGLDLLNKLLTYDPEKRITAEAALVHEWFREIPLPKSKEFMPTFPARHEQDR